MIKDSFDGPKIPWPGPRPYEEEDWEIFLGRDSDLEELLGRIGVTKLTVLLGGSGIGKTSLIRAGLVPLLRHERYHPEGDQTTWPVLLLRRWGNLGSGSLKENLLLQLHQAVGAIQEWGVRLEQERAIGDAEALSATLSSIVGKGSRELAILEVVEELARTEARRCKEEASSSQDTTRQGGLILIFDQFEEQLRGSQEVRAQALELIANLARSTAPTRILLAMRKEFQPLLRTLELAIGGLSRNSYFLEPLSTARMVEVIGECSARTNLPIECEVASQIVGWLGDGREESADQDAFDIPISEGPMHSRESERGHPDLLQLQAVLLEVSRYAIYRGEARVSTHLLDEFTSSFGQEVVLGRTSGQGLEGTEWESLLAQRVIGGALERWFESALSQEVSLSYAHWTDMEPKDLLQQVRRIAVRLAPLLSSGDYRVSQEEDALFRQALGDEILRLGLKDPELRSRIRIIEEDGGPPHLNWNELGADLMESPHRETVLSGLARTKGWTVAETGDSILLCFKETLHRLAAANVLQHTSYGPEARVYWELVHDQLGPSFTRWAGRQRGTWDDCKNSLVVSTGVYPIAVPYSEIRPWDGEESYDLVRVSWQSCSIENSRSGRLCLRNVRFMECYLVGTIFEGIEFIGCLFEDCKLNGVLFRNCSFSADENGFPTTFKGCDADIAIVHSTIADLEFTDCHLQQPAFTGIRLLGEIRYTEGSRVIQGYFDVRQGDGEARIVFDHASRAAFCISSPESYQLLTFANLEMNLHNSPLVDEYKVRP